jgi:hypothetical protein
MVRAVSAVPNGNSQMALQVPVDSSQPQSGVEEHSPQLEKREHELMHGYAESWIPDVHVQLCCIGTS